MSIENLIRERNSDSIPRLSSLWLWVYQCGLLLVGIGILAGRLLKGRGIPGWRERLAWYSTSLQQRLASLDRPIWIHAVSVGEVLAAQPLIEQFQEKFPQQGWLITTVTPTGQNVAKRLIREGKDQLLYLPWDFGPPVRRAIRTIRPSLFLIFETELWPLLFHEMGKTGIPLILVNGRISPSAYRRYLWVRPFLQRALAPVTFFLTQSPQDARRYAGIGAPKDRIIVTGNLKWDLKATEEGDGVSVDGASARALLGLKPEAILWTAGSTHPGEERMVLQVYKNLKSQWPALRLLLAPRHPDRILEVEQQVRQTGLSSVRRGSLRKNNLLSSDDSVILLDTLGELVKFYAASDLVFVGGSLIPHGGHNLVEPALFRRPIVTGPHLNNFQTIAETLSHAGGLSIVQSTEELQERMTHLIAKPDLRKELGARAFGVIQDHRGATQRTIQYLLCWRRGEGGQ